MKSTQFLAALLLAISNQAHAQTFSYGDAFVTTTGGYYDANVIVVTAQVNFPEISLSSFSSMLSTAGLGSMIGAGYVDVRSADLATLRKAVGSSENRTPMFVVITSMMPAAAQGKKPAKPASGDFYKRLVFDADTLKAKLWKQGGLSSEEIGAQVLELISSRIRAWTDINLPGYLVPAIVVTAPAPTTTTTTTTLTAPTLPTGSTTTPTTTSTTTASDEIIVTAKRQSTARAKSPYMPQDKLFSFNPCR